MPSQWLRAFLSQLFVVALSFNLSYANPSQTTPPSGPAPPPPVNAAAVTPASLEAEGAELERKIKASQEAENQQTALQLGVDLSLLRKRTELLRDLRESCFWWVITLEREADLEKEKADLPEKLAALKERGVPDPPPYTLAFYDNLLSRLQCLKRQQEANALTKAIFSETYHAIEADRQEAGKKKRLLQDRLAAATLPEDTKKLQFEVELASLEKDLAEKGYLSSQTYGNLLKLHQDLIDPQIQVYRELAAWVLKHLRIQDSDLESQLSLLAQKKEAVEARRTKLQQLKQEKAKQWDKTDQEIKSAESGSLLQEEASREKQTWRQAYHEILDVLGNRLGILEYEEGLWEKRLALLQGAATQEQLLKWQEELQKNKEWGGKLFKFLGTQNVFLQGQLSAVDDRLAEPNLNPRLIKLLASQREAYLAMIQEQHDLVQNLVGMDQLVRRLSDEINARLFQDPWTTFKAHLRLNLQRFLDFEIWVIEQQSVTVSKFLGALAFLILGLLLAKIILHYLIYPILEKTLWRHVKADILKKGVSYLAYTIVVLITLGKLRIPLQSFATLGGGIAIGLGFAAQTVIKNFVSGFILLGEKPFGLGDLVEVGGLMGNVHDIGSRSTLLRTGENKDILVPNSFFLENTITNWTRRDRKIRTEVSVGVAYGSPVAEVRDLLLQAAAACGQILPEPQPFVLFNDFGDNALSFDIYFWIEVWTVTERRRIQSDLRDKIDELFRNAGVTIAFPQRDVHLDGPLEVHLIDKEL